MKCAHCDVSPETGGALYRTNPKGEPAQWACAAHVLRVRVTPFQVWLWQRAKEERKATKG